MLDKRKIRLMSKLTLYEQNQGKRDIKISEYYKKDYVSFHTISTALWVTFGYMLIWGLIALCYVQDMPEDMSIGRMIIIAIFAVGGYIAILITYIIVAHRHYNRLHKTARKGVRKYNQSLIRLLRTYEREKRKNGKSINS